MKNLKSVHPGEILEKEFMKSYGLSISDLSLISGKENLK